MTAERTPLEDSPLSQPLTWLTEQTLRAPAAVLWGAAILTLVAILITANGLTIKTSRLDLLNPESSYNQRWLAYLAEFGDRDDAVIVVRSHDPAAVRAAVDDLAAKLADCPLDFDSILWQRDLTKIKAKGLHFLPPEELRRLAAGLRAAQKSAQQARALADPAAALARLSDELEHTPSLSPGDRERLEHKYAQIAEALAALADPAASTPAPGSRLDAPAAMLASIKPLLDEMQRLDRQYLTADDGQIAFVLVRFTPAENEFARGGRQIGKLRQIIGEVRPQHFRAWIGLTGMPVIEYDEMQASQFDMLWTSVLSLAGVVLLFVAGYGGLRHAGMATAVLLVGMAWSFAFVTLAVGHLNILSSAFGIVLIGLGIDFGIHYAASYLRLRGQGLDAERSLVRTAAEVGPGVVTGGVTTAAAFFMAGLTQFLGVRELGIVAGGGILLCVLAAVVVLPPLILVCDRGRPPARLPQILPVAGWLAWLHRRPGMVVSLAVVVAALCVGGVSWLRYDHNLLNLQPRHVESVEIEREIFIGREESVWFAVSICNSRQEVIRRKARFERLPSVAKTEEIASLVPPSGPARQRLIAEIHDCLAQLPLGAVGGTGGLSTRAEAPASADPAATLLHLRAELARAAALLNRDLPYASPAAEQLANASQILAQVPPERLTRALVEMGWRVRAELEAAMAPLRLLAKMADASPPSMLDLPPALVDRYVGRNHKHLLKVYARGDIWDMDNLTRFVAQVEAVDPRITGHPIQTYYASRHMQASYLQAGAYALVAVFALLLIDFRSIRYSLLAMTPLAMGFVQMCGLIGWLGIPLNAANMIVLPLLLGIGVDDGVHLVHELRRQTGRFRLGDSTALALLLTSTTTMASFGSLILARHQGLRSLGQVLTLGVGCCLATSVLVFPALLWWLTRKRTEAAEVEERAGQDEVASSDAATASQPPIELPRVVSPEGSFEEPVESRFAAEVDPLAPRPMIVPRRRAG
jgi:hypothetical protein